MGLVLPVTSYQFSKIKSMSLETFVNEVVSELALRLHYFQNSVEQIEAWNTSAHWMHELATLVADSHPESSLTFEFEIPLSTERPDMIIVSKDHVLVIEAKTGSHESVSEAKKQTLRYARSIYNYINTGREKTIVPVLLRQIGKGKVSIPERNATPVLDSVLDISPSQLHALMNLITPALSAGDCNPQEWLYNPRPTIIDAARTMFSSTRDRGVLSSLANDEELNTLSDKCIELIREAKNYKLHTILAVTGVPGAGKTLVGLKIANSDEVKSICDDGKTSGPLYLSGNGPLVDVLTEALSRDEKLRTGCNSQTALEIAQTKIRLIHGITKDKFAVNTHVLIFDEAQRAWSESHMRQKTQNQLLGSEPVEVLKRMELQDWSVVVCLVGTGQQINSGENGMATWTAAVGARSATGVNWKMYGDHLIAKLDHADTNLITDTPSLNLKIVRRAENASNLGEWVGAILEGEFEQAKKIRESFQDFQIFTTRSLQKARAYLNDPKHPRYETRGLLASSRSARLSTYGVDAQSDAGMTHDWTQWFLDIPPNLNSSGMLEIAASEFKCQGLELDKTCVCWSWDLVLKEGKWLTRRINKRSGKWGKNEAKRDYGINAYRVLLTRARTGMVIWVPEGEDNDKSRSTSEMDKIFEILQSVGCKAL